MRPSHHTLSLLLVLALFVWAGMVAAISFMEAPLKFTAPNITVVLGVGIGRIVFHALNKAELALSLVALLSAGLLGVPSRIWLTLLTAVTILLAQTLWLLPALDVRAAALLAGSPNPPNSQHLTYVVLEALKLLTLFTSGSMAFGWAMRMARRREDHRRVTA
ncbi:hypothetical protein [Solirubrum puertoriconensis]|uniref:DUF4149 domain-containing protein n=1 Tax=Solirubrum puertoriconensis TaxID=1751427 RepID=A0A9X0HL50_SOLP1|nr:hypothetical protein [Solirubrum puertoriconensis]KUG08016.1 hypothetical protein ASU33_07355 [Solirubrum puertoriconensis]